MRAQEKKVIEETLFSPTVALLLLAAAMVLAVLLRFLKLDQIPPGFTFDEAAHALDALDILEGNFILLSPRIRQNPAGYMYFLAGAFQLFGTSTLIPRALTAVFGSLLIPLNFLAVRTLFGQEPNHKAAWIAAFSSLLLASSFWGVNASRKGFEYMLPPAFAAPAIFFFWRGYRDGRWGLLLLAGIFTASGFYMYAGSAPFLLVIPTSILLDRLLRRVLPNSSKTEPPVPWKVLGLFSLAVVVFATPLLLALVSGQNPHAGRSLRLSLFRQADDLAHFLELLSGNLVAYAQPFLALGGDDRWYANLPGRPILNPVLAVCFVAGVLISLKRSRQLPYLFLLVYWGAMIAPAVLTVAGSSNTAFYFRMTSALPPTYILVALTWAELYVWLKAHLTSARQERLRRTASGLTLVPFLFAGLIWLPLDTYRDYFLVWAAQPEVGVAHDAPILTLVERMERETDLETVFILPRDAREPRPNYTLDFLYHGKTPFRYIIFDEETARATLTSKLAGYRTVHLITKLKGGRERVQRWATANPLLPLLFEKYGVLQDLEKTDGYTIQTYRLNSSNVDFEAHLKPGVPPDFAPLSFVIADQVKLAGIKQHLDGDNLFVDLAWQGWVEASDVEADYTVFIQLLDENGQRVTGVDVLPDRGFTKLDRQETMVTHYAIPLSNIVKPGAYTMLIGLYYFDNDQLVNVGVVTLAEPLSLE
ncbi:MAG: glycosyltransferase family 39 protein [Anaerolineae bacterium]